MKHIVVVGGGFAGLWSAVGAARKLDELGKSPADAEITLIEQHDYHDIRVRNYEPNPSFVVPLDDVLGPIGAKRIQGEAFDVDTANRRVRVRTMAGLQSIGYDRLVYAAGSHVCRPAIPGIADYAYDVDSHPGARRLQRHLWSLPYRDRDYRYAMLVVGAGLTGIECATQMPGRLEKIKAARRDNAPVRIILADRRARIGSDMGDEARAVIAKALATLGVETRTGIDITAVGPHGVTLADGGSLSVETVVWCTGMRASDLGQKLGVPLDRFGRVEVDRCLRVKGLEDVFAAGDVAWFEISKGHKNVMSCQHGRPMGRFAGHNVAADLFGAPLLPLEIDWYVTVLDLGPQNAVYTEGWDRRVVSTGEAAQQTKRTINRARIYPPRTGKRADILAAAAPVVQAPPERNGGFRRVETAS